MNIELTDHGPTRKSLAVEVGPEVVEAETRYGTVGTVGGVSAAISLMASFRSATASLRASAVALANGPE